MGITVIPLAVRRSHDPAVSRRKSLARTRRRRASRKSAADDNAKSECTQSPHGHDAPYVERTGKLRCCTPVSGTELTAGRCSSSAAVVVVKRKSARIMIIIDPGARVGIGRRTAKRATEADNTEATDDGHGTKQPFVIATVYTVITSMMIKKTSLIS